MGPATAPHPSSPSLSGGYQDLTVRTTLALSLLSRMCPSRSSEKQVPRWNRKSKDLLGSQGGAGWRGKPQIVMLSDTCEAKEGAKRKGGKSLRLPCPAEKAQCCWSSPGELGIR